MLVLDARCIFVARFESHVANGKFGGGLNKPQVGSVIGRLAKMNFFFFHIGK